MIGNVVDEKLPPPVPFVPVATMFKLTEPDSSTVECVACGFMFPLSDLLSCELEQHECPKCLTTAGMFYGGKPHRVAESEQGD